MVTIFLTTGPSLPKDYGFRVFQGPQQVVQAKEINDFYINLGMIARKLVSILAEKVSILAEFAVRTSGTLHLHCDIFCPFFF